MKVYLSVIILIKDLGTNVNQHSETLFIGGESRSIFFKKQKPILEDHTNVSFLFFLPEELKRNNYNKVLNKVICS